MMKIIIDVPEKDAIVQRGVVVQISPKGNSWSERQLGQYAKEQGVYVLHQEKGVLYVGKTNGEKMTFGVRLRREFQQSAAQNRHIYPKLAKLARPPKSRLPS